MAIVKRKTKAGIVRYQVRVEDRNGKWFPSVTFDSLTDAKAEDARLCALRDQGKEVQVDDARKVTVFDFWEVWSEENRTDVSDGWKISQNQMFRDYVRPVLGEMKMIEVDAPAIGKVMNRAKKMGKSDQTREHIYTLLRRMFGDAVEYYEMLSVNPVKPKFHRPKVKQKERNFLLPAQSMQLIEYSRNHYLGPAVWLSILAGLRVSEVQGLVGQNVQFELGQILICRAYNNKTRSMQNYPKQQDWAYVPLPPMLREYLLTLDFGPDAFVAPGPDGIGMLSYNTYLPALARLCQRAGVPAITPHELRHSATEVYVQAGATEEDLRRLLNHASAVSTRRYIHRTNSRLVQIAGNISPALRVIEGGAVSPLASPAGSRTASVSPKGGVSNAG
jgi:integrase